MRYWIHSFSHSNKGQSNQLINPINQLKSYQSIKTVIQASIQLCGIFGGMGENFLLLKNFLTHEKVKMKRTHFEHARLKYSAQLWRPLPPGRQLSNYCLLAGNLTSTLLPLISFLAFRFSYTLISFQGCSCNIKTCVFIRCVKIMKPIF